jgi:integrase/recombinase XerD
MRRKRGSLTRDQNLPLSIALDGFFRTRSADGYSSNTLEMYRWALGLMERFLANNPPVAEIRPEDLQDFFIWLRDEYKPNRTNGKTGPLAGRSLENIWTAMRSFFNWIEAELELADRPDYAVGQPEYAKRQIIPLEPEEIRAILSACKTTTSANTNGRRPFNMRRPTALRDTALVLTLLDTGLRASELCRLTIEDLNLDSAEIFVIPYGTGRKTKSRTVMIGKPTIKAIWRYLATRDYRPDDPLFTSSKSSAPLNRNSVRQLLDELGKRAGVANVHPHRFRHTFAITYLRSGGDIFTLQRLLGHSSLTMVQEYLDIVQADVANAYRRSAPSDNLRL